MQKAIFAIFPLLEPFSSLHTKTILRPAIPKGIEEIICQYDIFLVILHSITIKKKSILQIINY